MRLHRAATAFALATLLAGMASSPAGSATINFSGTSDGSELNGPLMLTAPIFGTPVPFYAYDAFGNGNLPATSISGFTTLAPANPSDLVIHFDEIERLSTTFSPGGCTPSYSAGPPATFSNCDTVTNSYGGGGPPLSIALAGFSGFILGGEITSIVVTTDSADTSAPGFGHATGTFTGQITNGEPLYLAEVMALTGGTGNFTGTLDTFIPLCVPGTDPCTFSNAGSLNFVPEPASGLLLALGLGGLGLRRRAHLSAS